MLNRAGMTWKTGGRKTPGVAAAAGIPRDGGVADLLSEARSPAPGRPGRATPAGQDDDPTLLDELPNLGDILTGAPPALTERLLDAFDVQAVYNRDKHQVTIHATITDATPQALRDLLADPRADHNTPPASTRTAAQDPVSHLTGDTGSPPRASAANRAFRSGEWPVCR